MQPIDRLIAANVGLIYKQLHRFNLVQDQDAESVAYEALYNAIRTYNPSQDTRLSTYATACIYNSLGDHIRKQNNKRRLEVVSYNTPVDEEGHELMNFHPMYCSAESEVLCCERVKTICNQVDTIIAKMPGKKKQVIEIWRDSDFEMTTTCIADAVGVSQSYVSQVISIFKNTLRNRLKED